MSLFCHPKNFLDSKNIFRRDTGCLAQLTCGEFRENSSQISPLLSEIHSIFRVRKFNSRVVSTITFFFWNQDPWRSTITFFPPVFTFIFSLLRRAEPRGPTRLSTLQANSPQFFLYFSLNLFNTFRPIGRVLAFYASSYLCPGSSESNTSRRGSSSYSKVLVYSFCVLSRRSELWARPYLLPSWRIDVSRVALLISRAF